MQAVCWVWVLGSRPLRSGSRGSSKSGGHADAGLLVLDPTQQWLKEKDPSGGPPRDSTVTDPSREKLRSPRNICVGGRLCPGLQIWRVRSRQGDGGGRGTYTYVPPSHPIIVFPINLSPKWQAWNYCRWLMSVLEMFSILVGEENNSARARRAGGRKHGSVPKASVIL